MQAQLTRSLEADVRRMIEDVKREVFAFHRKAVEDRLLQFEVQTQRDMYVFLLKRLHELRVVEQLRVGNATLLDPAEAPTAPIGTNTFRQTMVGLLVGLVIGWGIAMGFASSDPTIRTSDDLIHDTGPALPWGDCTVPTLAGRLTGGRADHAPPPPFPDR